MSNAILEAIALILALVVVYDIINRFGLFEMTDGEWEGRQW